MMGDLVDRRELVLLGMLLGVYALWVPDSAASQYKLINVAGPSALILVLLTGAWWHITRTRFAIWQPVFWFRIACAAYYGVGALAHYVANDATVNNMKGFYNFTDEDAFTVGLINVLSILAVLSTVAIVNSRFATRAPAPVQSKQSRTLLFAAILLIGGGVVRYLIVLPWSLGLTDIVPGVLVPLARCYVVGLNLLLLGGLRGSKIALLLTLILVPIELSVDLLTFAKTEVLLTLIFAYLAVLHQKFSLPRAVIGLALVLGVYSQLDPVIHYGREELERRTGSSARGPLADRLEILAQYSGTQWQGTERDEIQMPLRRLSYVNAAAMVVNWHDAGQPGTSLGNALIVLVPRIVWPDKPVITSVGTDLYTAATGREGASFSPGLFAEAYWNLGWGGIPLLMVPLGVILALFSRYSLNVMLQERWLHFPSVLLGVYAGCRVDGWYVVDIIGGFAIALTYAVVARLLQGLLSHHSPRLRGA